MKSLKVKEFSLKDPRLRKIRNNLRLILKLAILDRWSYLHKVKGLYTEKREERGLVPSQDKRESEIIKEKNWITKVLGNSIFVCSHMNCVSADKNQYREDRPSDLDMVWIPWHESWYCKACYMKYFKDETFDSYIKAQYDMDDTWPEHIEHFKHYIEGKYGRKSK